MGSGAGLFVDEQQAEASLINMVKPMGAPDSQPALLDMSTGTGRLLSALAPYIALA